MKKRIILPIVLGALFCMSGCSIGTSNENINTGMDAIEGQNYSGAISYFDEAIEKGEDARLAYRGLGIAYMGQGKYDEAVSSFEKALHQSNGLIKKVDYDISYYLAMAEYKRGNLDKAYDTYCAILELDDDATEAYYLRGKVELLKGNKASAIEDYNRALELKSNDYDMYIAIYEDLSSAGYTADGVEYINSALEKNSKMTDYQQGLFAYYLGNYDEAKAYLEKAKEKNDSNRLELYLGRCYKALGDTNYAASVYTNYISTGNADASIYNELGLMRMESGEYQSALAAFEEGLALEDSAYTQSLMFNEIVAYEFLTDFQKANVLIGEYLKLYPDDEQAKREEVFLRTR